VCKLAPPLQKLVQLIFDVNLMKQVMLEFEVGMHSSAVAVLKLKRGHPFLPYCFNTQEEWHYAYYSYTNFLI
jgi:hypothetical protein